MRHSLEMLEKRRTARLETSNKILLIAIGTCLVIFLSGAATPLAELRAKSFQLLAEDGTVRAELVTRYDSPGLFLKDPDGVDRVAVFHDPDSSGMYVMDSAGVTRIGIAQFSHGGGGLALHGPESKGAAVLYFKREGSLRLFDADGNITNEIRASTDTADE